MLQENASLELKKTDSHQKGDIYIHIVTQNVILPFFLSIHPPTLLFF